MKKYILIFAAIACLLCSCDKHVDGNIPLNTFNPTTISIGAEGGEVTIIAEKAIEECYLSINHIDVYEHKTNENGNHALIYTSNNINKSTGAMNIGDRGYLGQVSVEFTDANTLVFTVAPCDEDKHLNIRVIVSNTGTDGRHFAPSALTILQNE